MRSATTCGETFFATTICLFSARRSIHGDSDMGSKSSVSKKFFTNSASCLTTVFTGSGS